LVFLFEGLLPIVSTS